MELQAAILAATIGTVFMTLSSTTEMHIRGRPESTAPGRGAAWFLKFVGIKIEDGTKAMYVLSTWSHWLYGGLWGIAWWLWIVQLEMGLFLASVVHFLVVWVAAFVGYKVYGIADWPWKWGGIKWAALDWFHHFTLVAGTVVGWVAIEQIVEHALSR